MDSVSYRAQAIYHGLELLTEHVAHSDPEFSVLVQFWHDFEPVLSSLAFGVSAD